VLDSTFFERSAESVGHDLIGCHLCWRLGDQTQSRIITETEAYIGPDDLASHAARGRTDRNAPMFGPPGTFYVYFVYGMHWMLNVVTGPIGYPAAVLIRGVEGLVGPARLTKAIGINGSLNGKKASKRTGLWFTQGTRPKQTPDYPVSEDWSWLCGTLGKEALSLQPYSMNLRHGILRNHIG
jgi:DNA-3-methyladenine glycosylase